jgi:hypothetical protein
VRGRIPFDAQTEDVFPLGVLSRSDCRLPPRMRSGQVFHVVRAMLSVTTTAMLYEGGFSAPSGRVCWATLESGVSFSILLGFSVSLVPTRDESGGVASFRQRPQFMSWDFPSQRDKRASRPPQQGHTYIMIINRRHRRL